MRKLFIAGLALAVVVVAAAAYLGYLPFVHGTTADEIERMAAWLEIKPGSRVADLGAGDGTYAVALATRVGPSGHVFATEIEDEKLAEILDEAKEAGVSNIAVIKGEVANTNLPKACCDAVVSRNVYHHLTDPDAINAGTFQALRPGGRLLIIDFEPGGIMDWFGRPQTADRHGGHGTPKETVVKEVKAAGFEVIREPEPWRGRSYAALFRRP